MPRCAASCRALWQTIGVPQVAAAAATISGLHQAQWILAVRLLLLPMMQPRLS
jgi:hypothetical protein